MAIENLTNPPEIELKITNAVMKNIEKFFQNRTSFVPRADIEEKNPEIYKLHLIFHYIALWISGIIGLITLVIGLGKF